MQDNTLGQKIRNLRKKQKLTLTSLAELTGFSVSYLSQVERGLVNPSISSLKKISETLKFPAMEIMFGKGQELSNSVTVTQKEKRKAIIMPGSDVKYELITPDLRKQLSVLWLVAKPSSDSGEELFQHFGEDCIFVIKGKLVIVINSTEYCLNEGDSIYFNSELPHRWYNPYDEEANVIWISSPPSF